MFENCVAPVRLYNFIGKEGETLKFDTLYHFSTDFFQCHGGKYWLISSHDIFP